MPVTVLLVEGQLDSQILSRILQPGPNIEPGGSRGSLAPQARERRRDKRVNACYIRDRDFDYEPPEDRSRPDVDRYSGDPAKGEVLGWRWCRHEIESYLLEPRIVANATRWAVAEFTSTLIDAGRRIAEYTAVRWSLGLARKRLADVRHIKTRPQPEDRDIWLPADLSLDTNVEAAAVLLEEWRRRTSVPDETAIREDCRVRAGQLAGLGVAEEVLTWHSGKDLFAALREPLRQRLGIEPETLRIRLRDWFRDDPEDAIQLLPEWVALHRALTA